MEFHANSLIANGLIDSTYQRGYDVILFKLNLNTAPLTQNMGFIGVSPAASSAQATDSIFYGLYCCNYDVKLAICAGNF